MSVLGWFLSFLGFVGLVVGLLQMLKGKKMNSVPFRAPSQIAQLGPGAADAKGMVSTEGTVSQQCKSMGCYFFFPSGTKTLRVELKDIAMTAPMREGRAARVEGQIVPYDDGYQLYANAIEFK